MLASNRDAPIREGIVIFFIAKAVLGYIFNDIIG